MANSIIIGKISTIKEGMINADFKRMSEEISISDFLYKFIEEFLCKFKVYEIYENECEEAEYSEINQEKLKDLRDKIDTTFMEKIKQYSQEKSRESKDETIKVIENLNIINCIIRDFYKEKIETENIKILLI